MSNIETFLTLQPQNNACVTYPMTTAIPKITIRKAIIIGVRNIDFSKITSVKLAPALPMMSAITAPIPMPLVINTEARGITASARI